MQFSRKAVGLMFAGLLAIAAAVGGYCSLPSYGDDSSAQINEPAGETTGKAGSTATGDVIEGLVVNEREEPQPGMDVWTVDWKTRKSAARSGPDGRFRLAFPGPLIAEFILLASNADGTQQGILTAKKLGPGRFPLQQVVLKPSRTLHVETVDKRGNPVAGAPVYVDLSGGTSCHITLGPVLTDARGKARLATAEDAKLEWIAAFKGGMGMDYVYLQEDGARRPWSQESAEAVKLVLNGAMRVSVRLRDSLGRGVAGAQVAPWQLWKKGNPVFFFRTAPVWAVSDAQGEVQFDWLPADLEKRVSFSIRSGDYYYPVQAGLPMKDAGGGSLEVTLPAPAQIGGKVTYPDGRPAVGIMIQAEGMGSAATRDWARTAKDGTYRLEVHPNNSYLIAVVDDQWAAASRKGIVLKEGEIREGLSFQLNEGTLIHGTIPLRADMPERFSGSEPMLLEFGPEIPDEWKSSPFATPWGDGEERYRVRLWRSTTPEAKGHYAFRVGPGEYELLLPGIPGKTTRLTVTNQREIVLEE